MGNGPKQKQPNKHSKIKKYKRMSKTPVRGMDTDQKQDIIANALLKGIDPTVHPYDDDLPGAGQFYAMETDTHFIDAKALADHKKTRFFKKRAKELKEEKYTQESAELHAGMTKEKLPSMAELREKEKNITMLG
jgi:bud site selection protein 20